MRALMVVGYGGANQTRTHCKGDTKMAQSAATAQTRPVTGGFLEVRRALFDNRPHTSAGGRWLDDDMDAPTRPTSLTFPSVREPNDRADLPLPAFLRS
jgi:hypothetical protein